jgi:hypothetical protein
MADGGAGETMVGTLRARRSRRQHEEQTRAEAAFREQQARGEALVRLRELQGEVVRMASKQEADRAFLLEARLLSARTPAQVDVSTPWQAERREDMRKDGAKTIARQRKAAGANFKELRRRTDEVPTRQSTSTTIQTKFRGCDLPPPPP